MITPDVFREDKTPFNEMRALKKRLSGIEAYASNYPEGRTVPVHYVKPDLELVTASYPGIYLSYAGISKASEREVRGPTRLTYAPPGYPTDTLVPADLDDKNSVAQVPWESTGFDRLRSPYYVQDHPIPYNLDFNVTVLTRNAQQMFGLVQDLQMLDFIPARFGGLEVPEDGTVRTLELLGGPDTSPINDEAGKRLFQSVYSVRVAAELNLYAIQEIQRVTSVNLTVSRFTPQYL